MLIERFLPWPMSFLGAALVAPHLVAVVHHDPTRLQAGICMVGLLLSASGTFMGLCLTIDSERGLWRSVWVAWWSLFLSTIDAASLVAAIGTAGRAWKPGFCGVMAACAMGLIRSAGLKRHV
jgi:hypothetical protein